MPFLCLPKPTLERAQRWRWYLLISSFVENLFFSLLLFGWSALFFMLKAEGFYEGLCDDQTHDNHTDHNATHDNDSSHGMHSHGGHGVLNGSTEGAYESGSGHASMRKLLSGGFSAGGSGCSAQDTTLNLAYTIGLFSMTGSSFIIGALQDKFGYKPVRLASSSLFCLGNVMMAMCSKGNESAFFPGLVVFGIGGMGIGFSSMQIANLFGTIRSTVLGIVVGGFSSAAIVFPLFKTFYDQGMAYSTMYAVLGIGGLWVFLNCVFTWPMAIIPIPADLQGRIYMEQLRISPTKEGPKVKQMGRRMSEAKLYPYHNIYTSRIDLLVEEEKDDDLSLVKVVCGPVFMLGLLFLAIMFLRVLLFIGMMHLELLKFTDDIALVSQYINIFGYLQVICLFTCPLMNMLLDRGILLKKPDDVDMDDSEWAFTMKVQKLKNCMLCFIINTCILLVFGVTVLIPNLQIQILSFVAHTVIRGTGQAALLGLFAAIFPFQFIGKLLGLQILISAVVDVVQSPIFILVETQLHGDPTMVDICLLAGTFFCFALPIYLFFKIKSIKTERVKKRKSIKSSDIQYLIQKGDPYAVQHLQAFNKSNKGKEAFV